MTQSKQPHQEPGPSRAGAMDRRSAIKGLLAGSGGVFAPRVLAYTEPSRGLSDTDGITGFSPSSGNEGTVVVIGGRGFGLEPRDLSIKMIASGQVVFTRPFLAAASQANTTIRAIPLGMQPAPIQMSLGSGVLSTPGNIPAPFTLSESIRTWKANGGSTFLSVQSMNFPWAGTPDPDCLRYWGSAAGGVLTLTLELPLDEDCCPTCPGGSLISMDVCGQTAGGTNDVEFQISFFSAIDLRVDILAQVLCMFYQSAFLSHHGDSVSCSVSPIDDQTVEMSLSAPSGSFIGGAVHVRLCHEPDFGGSTSGSIAGSSSDSINRAGMTTSTSTSGSGSIGDCQTVSPHCSSIDFDLSPFTFD